MKKIFFQTTILIAVLLAGCTEEKIIYEGTALGLPQDSYEIEATEGSVQIDVIANKDYSINSSAQWISYPPQGHNRDGFKIDYRANDGVARIAMVVLSIENTHRDTLWLRQKGVQVPYLTVTRTSVLVEGECSNSIDIKTNLKDDEISVSVTFPEGDDVWITGVAVKSSKLVFDCRENPTSSIRTARIDVNYVNESGYVDTVPVFVTQKSKEGSEGVPTTFEQLRSMASIQGKVIEDDLILDGIVVSNKESGNMGDNTQLAIVGIDYSVCQKTIYLESPDGQYGIKILADSEDDNIFNQFDAAKLSLRGMTVVKNNPVDPVNTPVYYSLKGFNKFNIVSITSSTAPVKERTIASLTDDDLFTYVTLKDCQLPFRKGSLTPVDEKVTNASSTNKVNKFAINLYDRYGSSIYVYTNTTCPYRRDGHRLPYGSGDMNGVVVHELYSRFVYEDNASGDKETYGNIGRYQIRHTGLDDFRLASDMSTKSFSTVLAEWRYIVAANQEKYYATDGDKTAFFKHSFANTIAMYDDYSYLGPVGTVETGFFGINTGNINGLGVILEDGTDWMSPDYVGPNSAYAVKVNNISSAPGSGVSPSTIGASWSTNVNYNSTTGEPTGLVLNFNTKGISASHLSLHLSMMSLFVKGQSSTGPRHFNIEYSFDNAKWTRTDSFILPDYTSQDNPVTQLWQSPGYKQMTFALPSELLGKGQVFVRIFPDADMKVGTYTKYLTDYSGSTKSIPRTLFNYIGIRYND